MTTVSSQNATDPSSYVADSTTSIIYNIGYVCVPALLVLGVVGNSLTIRVMASASFKTLPVSKMLIAMSLSDTVVNLLFPFNKPFVRQLLGTDIRALSSGGCKLFFWTYRFAKTTSSWMVVLITLERFVAVWLPIKARFINTERNVYAAIAVLYGAFAVFFGYWCSWSDRIIDDSCIINSRPAGYEYLSEVFLVTGLVLYSFGPSVVLLIFNSLIVYKLINIRKKTIPEIIGSSSASSVGQTKIQTSWSAAKSAARSRTTIMLLVAAIAFVILVTPNAVANIVSFARREALFETIDPVMVSWREIGQILEQCNHSINFLLYVVYNKRFRDGVLMIFRPNIPQCRADC